MNAKDGKKIKNGFLYWIFFFVARKKRSNSSIEIIDILIQSFWNYLQVCRWWFQDHDMYRPFIFHCDSDRSFRNSYNTVVGEVIITMCLENCHKKQKGIIQSKLLYFFLAKSSLGFLSFWIDIFWIRPIWIIVNFPICFMSQIFQSDDL